jgi:hypothetical protein
MFRLMLLVCVLFPSVLIAQDEPVGQSAEVSRRVDGYLFDDKLQAAGERGNGPLAQLVEARVALMEEKLNEKMEGRIRDAIPDLGEIRESIKEWKSDRQEFGRLRDRIGEVEGRWTPVQSMVDRLTGLVWKLMILIASLCALAMFVFFIGLYLYRKLSSKIAPLASLASGGIPITEIVKLLESVTKKS